MRIAAFTYGLVAYCLFLVTFVYAIGFVHNVAVPTSIDSGAIVDPWTALLLNAGILMLFAVQHSIMARPWFKKRWTKIVSPAIERSTFVLATVGVFAVMFTQWHPIPELVWSVESPVAVYAIYALAAMGWLIVLLATFMIGHFELFGLAQVWHHLRNKPGGQPRFRTPGFYRVVRHPIMLGFLIAFWATPTMTVGHLVFAIGVTGFILVALQFEERDLKNALGGAYEEYSKDVPMLLPKLSGSKPSQADVA